MKYLMLLMSENAFTMALEYIDIVLIVLTLVRLYNLNLKHYQQSHYHLSSFSKYFKYFYMRSHIFFIIPIAISIFFLNYWFVQLLSILYLGFLNYYYHRQKEIIKLKFTSRIIREYLVIIILDIVIGTLLLYHFEFVQLMSLMSLLIIIAPIIVLLASLVTLPVEALISVVFQKQAKHKIDKIKPYVIAITGSAGKTSTKSIIYEVLSKVAPTLKTPLSYNTINGISRTINEYMTKNDEYFVCEMGASYKKDIDDILKLVKPNISIVTTINNSHLETFKSIENICCEKMKICEALDSSGIAILNYDNEYIRSYKLKSSCKVITIGSTTDCDYYQTDFKMNQDYIEFKIHHNVDNVDKVVDVKAKLKGEVNCYNLLASYACLDQLDLKNLDDNLILDSFLGLTGVSNRLEIKHDLNKNNIILDDSYNSNYYGFCSALKVLDLYSNKVLITPGIVEASDDDNIKISKKISEVCDQVIIINCPSGNIIYNELSRINFTNVTKVNSYKEAIESLENCTILVENDLPDYYFLGR